MADSEHGTYVCGEVWVVERLVDREPLLRVEGLCGEKGVHQRHVRASAARMERQGGDEA